MSNDTTTNLFAGKARTVAAVAAFSGLALATTVSVQATQNADEQAPAAAVSEAPAAETTVSAEPASKADKAQEGKAEEAKPAAQPSVVQAAPVAEVAPLEAPAAQQAPVAPQVAPASEKVTPVAEVAPLEAPAAQQAPVAPQVAPAPEKAAPVAEHAPAATQVAPASENVTPVVQQAPAQGRHAAQPTQQTITAENTARQDAQVYTAGGTTNGAQQTSKGANATSNVTPQSTTTHTTQAKAASHVSASGKGGAILSAAEGQLGEAQDCTQLVSDSLAAVGIHHHGWPASYKSLGTPVSAAQAQAGDIAYYADGGAGMAHVAIYAGNGQAIHGGWSGNQTVKTSAYVGSGPEFIRVG